MAFLQNAFRKNKTQQPTLEFFQLDEEGNFDPVATANLEMQTQPRTLSEKLLGKKDTRDIQQIDPETGEAKLATIESYRPGFLDDFSKGYNDNYSNGFNINNFKNQPNKGFATRLGEGLGTVGRFIDSPTGRFALAAGLNSLLGYDNSLQEGLQAFSGRQNAVTADKLYRRQLKDYGYTDDDLAQIKGTISTDMYKNLSNNLYKTRNLDQNTYIKLKKVYDTQLQMGILSPEQYQQNISALNNQFIDSQVQTMQAGDVQESNQTRNTDSQIGYRNKRLEQYDQQLALIDKRIAQVGANASARIALEQQKLGIKQKRAEEEKIYKQEKAQDLAEFQQIYSGKDKGAKDYARNAYIKKYGEDPMKKLELF